MIAIPHNIDWKAFEGEASTYPFEIGYRSAIACQMAIKSYREGGTVKWDEKREETV